MSDSRNDGVLAALTAIKRRTAAVAVVSLCLLCLCLVTAGVLGAPSVSGVDNRFGGVNGTTTVVERVSGCGTPTRSGSRWAA